MLYIKNKLLQEQQLVVKYDKPSHSSFLQTYLNLLDHIYNSIEFRAVENKRRRKIYYKQLSTIFSFKLNSGKTYYYPANIVVSSVSRTDNNDHPDEHYCLAFIKQSEEPLEFYKQLGSQ
ncbi:591_t:CDS:2 [Cetraspora pellucida]|uniref:591_t:CDS:1 n=1 Tax=Cetraspora pellucida TaxID=1433469 RepID=A0A9N9FA97_9GLOM|nr:591_t:CDS:2 [Cetraspora pellucida]